MFGPGGEYVFNYFGGGTIVLVIAGLGVRVYTYRYILPYVELVLGLYHCGVCDIKSTWTVGVCEPAGVTQFTLAPAAFWSCWSVSLGAAETVTTGRAGFEAALGKCCPTTPAKKLALASAAIVSAG